MKARPTPETDASRGYALTSHYGRSEGSYLQMDRSGPFVHAEVARKLERERDEARELCSELLDLLAYGLGQSGEPWSLDAMRQATYAIHRAKQLGGSSEQRGHRESSKPFSFRS